MDAIISAIAVAALILAAGSVLMFIGLHDRARRLREDIELLDKALKVDSQLHSERHWSLYEAHHRSRRDVEALAALHGFEFREKPHRLAAKGGR